LAIHKYANYLTHKLTVSARGNRYCNWRVVSIKIDVDLRLALKDWVGVEMSIRKDWAVLYILLGCIFQLIERVFLAK
jgi:hypothetical protein